MLFDVWHRLSGVASRLASPARTVQQASTIRPGLFGVPGLGQPGTFRELVDDSISQCRALIDLLPLTQHSVESLRLVDQISDECCRVLDVAELIRHIHPQEAWRKESQLAHERMSAFMNELNSHPNIYHCLDQIQKSIFDYLNPEQKQMVSSLILDMKHNGIGLPSQTQVQLFALTTDIAKLETEFYRNVLHSSCENSPVRVHKRHLPSYVQTALSFHGEYVYLSHSNCDILLSHCTDRLTRKSIYMDVHSQAKDNMKVLDSLVKARREYSCLLGYSSYANLKLSGMLLQNSSRVSKFLKEISARIRSKASAEVKLLQSVRNGSQRTPIDAWDVPFYTTQIRRQMRLGLVQIPALPLDRLLSGFNTIVTNLFGIQIKHSSLNSVEAESFGNQLQKLLVLDCNANHVGTLYLDLYARPKKLSAPAQFTIQNPSPGVIPSAVITCSFNANNRYLRHSECVTLFHELGHALHLFLSESGYSHLAGTRGPSDFVEIASHVLEHFIWDYRILSVITGQNHGAMRAYLEKLQASRGMFFGLDTQTQVAYALMDQRLFGPANTVLDSTRLWSEIQNTHMSYQFVEGTHPYTTFSHFCGYGATYYSYLYARMISSHIWREFFLSDPMSANAGRRFRERFLAPGLGRNPGDILNNLLDGGPQPSVDAFIRNGCELD